MKLGPKSTEEVIFEKIEKVKEELTKKENNSLNSQFRLNKTLNELFRDYHGVIDKRVMASRSWRKESVQMNKTAGNPLGAKDEQRGRSTGMSAHSNSTPKSGRITYMFKRERPRFASVLDPFPEKSSYEESRKVETKIKQDKEVLELWKMKIDEHKEALLKALQSHRKPRISSRLSKENATLSSHRK